MGVLDSVSRAASKIDSNTKSASTSLFNGNPSQSSGKLNGIGQSITGATKSIAGTATSVGGTVAKIAGSFGGKFGKKIADALQGTQKTIYTPEQIDDSEVTGLKGFYNKLGGGNSPLVEQIDTLNTFECYMNFFPFDSKIINRYIIQNKLNQSDSQTFSYKDNDYVVNQKWNPGLPLDLGIYIQRLTLPNLKVKADETIQTMMGNFPVNGTCVYTESHDLIMEILNTKNSINESIFYPWMREVTSPKWSYGLQPYTTADITIDLGEHTNLKYKFLNCRPTDIYSYQPSQEINSTFSRQITFKFDYMFISYAYRDVEDAAQGASKDFGLKKSKKKESSLDKFTKIGNVVNFAASNILKI